MSGGLDIASLGIEVRADGVYISTKALKDLTKASKDAESQTKRTGSAAKSASSSFDSMASSVNFLSGVLKLEILRRAAMEIYELGKNVYKANLEMQSINNTFKAATGSATLGAQEMSFLREESKRLGLDLLVAADGYKTLTAAAKGTVLEGEGARNVFLAIAEASTVLGLSSQKTEMALYAVQQMISKGVVSMEELRRQLGDQIPGAFQIAARSMGLGEREFNKLVESGQLFTSEFMPAFVKAMREQFAGGVEDASQSARAELNRFNNAILDLKLEIGNGGFFNAMTEALREFARVLDDPNMKENMRAIGELAGTIVSGIGSVAKFANLRGRSSLQDQVTELFKSGEIGWGDKLRLDSKLGGFMGTGFKEGTTIGEKWEGMLEAQKEIDNILKARDERQKEAARLANPAQMSRDMEGAAARSLEAAQRQEKQEQMLRETREKGFEEWKRSVAKIDDTQRAINKLNDDYNAKIIAGVGVLQKYNLTKEQAETLSRGEDLPGLELMPAETRRAAEQAKEQFALAKKYRDQEEQEILDKQAREDKKTSDMYNKRQKKLNDINQDLAKLTMSDLDRELMDVDIKFSEIAAELGNIPPALIQWRDLQKELVTQNFADEMRDAMNGYLIQLKEAQVATSGIGAASLEVLTLEAEKAKELTEIRKKYYRVGADNSFYEDMTQLVEAQYELRIGAAKYAESWESTNRELEHAVELAEILGRGTHKATMDLLKSQRDQIANDPTLDPAEKSRQVELANARIASQELKELREQQAIWEGAMEQIMENTYNVGNIEAYFRVHEKLLQGQMNMLEIELQLAETESERMNILAQMEAISQQIKENKAAASLDFGALSEIGMQQFRSDAHMEIVDYYKNILPNAIKATSSAMGDFVGKMLSGEAQVSDAWKMIGSAIQETVNQIVSDLTRLFLQKALIDAIGALAGMSFGGGMSMMSPSPASSYGSASLFHGGGVVGVDSVSRRMVDMSMFSNAPRFHKGLMPDEFPAILKRKEGVFTEEQMKALGGASAAPKPNMTVNIHEAPGTSVRAEQSSDGMSVDVIVEMVESRMQSRVDHGRPGVARKRAYL